AIGPGGRLSARRASCRPRRRSVPAQAHRSDEHEVHLLSLAFSSSSQFRITIMLAGVAFSSRGGFLIIRNLPLADTSYVLPMMDAKYGPSNSLVGVPDLKDGSVSIGTDIMLVPLR